MKTEIWKDIKGYEGLYQVSNLGSVKSLPRSWYSGYNALTTIKERILKPGLGGHGYYTVCLSKMGKQKTFVVHQLVAMTFLEYTPCGYQLVIDHINDVKTDNRLENLQVVTQRENSYKTQRKYSSKYKGVSWDKKSNKWSSYITIKNKKKFLGYFTNEYDAHLKYQETLKTL